MAKRKKSKSTKKQTYSVELTGLILILIGVIGFGFGYIGYYLKLFSLFLFGNLWILLLIGLIITGMHMLFKREMPDFFSPKLIGIYVLVASLLILSHLGFLNNEASVKDIIIETYDKFMERASDINNTNALHYNGQDSIVIGGGLIGALISGILYGLFDLTGTKIVLMVLVIFGFILAFNVTPGNILDKIKEFFKGINKKEPKEIKLDENGDVEIKKDKKEEIEKDDKIVITSMDELKNPIKVQESFENNTHEEENVVSTPYHLPKFDLLDKPKEVKKVNSTEFTRSNKETLERVLRDFDIQAKVVEIHEGPAVTQYEITVPNGTKVSKISNINKEIALALAARDVRIEAPIPGKNTIGIEIPNESIAAVPIRDVLEQTSDQKSKNAIVAALGKDIMGKSITCNIAKMPHLLIAGSTGSGKSVCVNSIIASILMRYKPNEIKLVLVDPKKVELSNYNGIPHLLCPVVNDPKKASITLQKIVAEMEKRYNLFSEKEFKNIEGYNEWIEKENKKHPDSPLALMPYIVVIIDELADLMLVAAKDVEDSITRITQMARAAGIHLIVATQRPSTDVITGLVKNNIPSRISFAVSSQIDSRTILDRSGAEKLLGRGDMLYFPMGESAPRRIQGCFISDDEVKRLIDHCKKEQSAHYDDTMTNFSSSSAASSGGAGTNEADDEMYNEVVEFAIQTGKISASLIQRRFRFGYNRAARMIDLLEERGIVGPQNGSKPREVLVKLEKEEE